jgi:hypothetical protein
MRLRMTLSVLYLYIICPCLPLVLFCVSTACDSTLFSLSHYLYVSQYVSLFLFLLYFCPKMGPCLKLLLFACLYMMCLYLNKHLSHSPIVSHSLKYLHLFSVSLSLCISFSTVCISLSHSFSGSTVYEFNYPILSLSLQYLPVSLSFHVSVSSACVSLSISALRSRNISGLLIIK